jgi:hypothetical protein
MNRFCWRTSAPLTQRACPFRIMCIASYPSIVRRAVAWASGVLDKKASTEKSQK